MLLVIGEDLESEYGRLVSALAESHHAEARAFASLRAFADHCREAALGLSRDSVDGLFE